jgi:branched-chain amino acid transport system ATP-binding protein
MTDNRILEVKGVSKRFGGLEANKNITMDVRRGEILALIGPNGAGKSTLFNLIAGALEPTSGEIFLEGAPITLLPSPRRCELGIARTFQVPRSFDSMTVLENVMVGAFVRQRSTQAARTAAWDALVFSGLDHSADAVTSQLTPPERRRLELARAIATKPSVLLLDEVMTGLTPSEAQKGIELVRKIRDTGTTIVMVEHVMEIVMPLVDRAIVLHNGEVLAEGLPKDVVRDEGVLSAYLGDRYRAA